MKLKFLQLRPVLSPIQLVALVAVILALIIALDLNRKARAGEASGAGETALQAEIDLEQTRQVQLLATREYVQSDDYVAAYARNEAGYVQPGEVRVVPLTIEETPPPTPAPTATPDPVGEASPWQAWWELLTDADQPAR